jgi:coenzyme PQQ precursor peptide PqqA
MRDRSFIVPGVWTAGGGIARFSTLAARRQRRHPSNRSGRKHMSWKRPKIREICIGMEINGYLPADL